MKKNKLIEAIKLIDMAMHTNVVTSFKMEKDDNNNPLYEKICKYNANWLEMLRTEIRNEIKKVEDDVPIS